MKEEVIKLNLEGKTNTEIRSITGHSLTTISLQEEHQKKKV